MIANSGVTRRISGTSGGFRRFAAVTGLGLITVLLAAMLVIMSPPSATAQESGGLGGLLRRLFSAGGTRPPPAETYKPQIRKPVIRRSAPQPPEPPAPEKLDTARTILVVGDFMASGLADGLQEAFRESPGVKVVDAAKGSSGLVRDDYYDWPNEIGPIIDQYAPSVVTVMIGANDRQQINIGGKREAVRSDTWIQEYTRRANEIAAITRDKHVPLIWIGMVPFRSTRVSADILAFNDIYKAAAESVQGAFVDVWDGFVDENGTFVMSGPDINGQTTRLRTGDGTILSKAGKRLVAFFAEKPLRKLLGDATAPDIGELGPENLPVLRLDTFASPGGIERTPPMAVTDPDFDGSKELLGSSEKIIQIRRQTPVEQLSIEGTAPAAPAGRADDFILKDQGTDVGRTTGPQKTSAIK